MFLKRPKDRPKGTGKNDPRDLSITYHQLLIKNKKMKKKDVKEIVAEKYHTSVRNVEYAIKDFPMDEWGEDILRE